MRTSNTLYSGKTTLGKPAFGLINPVAPAGNYIFNKHVSYNYCNPSRCVKVTNYKDLYALKASIRDKYTTNKTIITSQKNNLVSGLYTKLDLHDVDVISNSTTDVSPTSITTSSTPYLQYNIDPSGKLFGNTTCGLNNFVNYKVANNYALNKILF